VAAEELPNLTDSPTPGAMLKAAREQQEVSQREAADLLNWMPDYVEIVERDEYTALRRPSFARGYVKAFGRLVALDESVLMDAFDALDTRIDSAANSALKDSRTPLQLQKTGLGVIVGLGSLSLIIAALWWWQGTVS
jgi:cytoskeletal protein RodZ